MKNIKLSLRVKSSITAGMVMGALLFMGSPLVAGAQMLTRPLQLGMSGADVSSLQTFLSTDSTVYPSGLVTGYFGAITKAGVERFQAKNGIVSSGTPTTTGYGRVGPQTIARINAQMGGGVVDNNKAAPFISAVSTNVSSNSAVVSWATNENASAVLYYSTSPLSMTESSATTAVNIGGSSILVNSNLQTSHTATVSNLNPNTTYYYVAYSRDGAGNESVTWPATFTTNQ